MRKVLPVVAMVFLVAGVAAQSQVNSVIDPGNPDDILLDEANNWEVDKTFDGSKSSGLGSLTYTWELGGSKSGSGINKTFTFNRNSSESNTIKLTVSNGTDSDSTDVTQTLNDQPEVSISASSSEFSGSAFTQDIDFGSGEEVEDGSVTIDFSSTVTDEYDDTLSYNWTVDGAEESTSSSFNKSFDKPEDSKTYDINFTVTDSDGYTNFISKTIDLDNETSGGGGSNNNNNNQQSTKTSSGAGGGAGSDEPGTKINFGVFLAGDSETREVGDEVVKQLSMTAASDLFDQVTVEVDSMEDRPNKVDEAPGRSVYRYLEFTPGNVTESEIETATVEFVVDKSWLEQNNIDKNTVRLERYDGGWNQLNTTLEEETDDNITYSAETPGFSVFAVTGESQEASFSVTSLELNTTSVKAGQPVKVTVTVENTGNIEGNYTVSFSVAGESYSRELTIGAGGSGTAEFTVVPDQEGSWTISLGDSSATLSAGTTDGEKDSTEQTGPGIPVFPIIIFVIMIGGLAGGVLYYTESDFEIEQIEQLKKKLELTEPSIEDVEFQGFGDAGDDEEDEEEDDSGFDYSFEG